jgi:hypothetical protein
VAESSVPIKDVAGLTSMIKSPFVLLKSIRGSEKRDIEDWSFESLDGMQKESNELTKKFYGWGWTPTHARRM